jgi:hypothetical protein
MPNTNAMDVSCTPLHLHEKAWLGLLSGSGALGFHFFFPDLFKVNKIVHWITSCEPTFFALQRQLVLIIFISRIRSKPMSRRA